MGSRRHAGEDRRHRSGRTGGLRLPALRRPADRRLPAGRRLAARALARDHRAGDGGGDGRCACRLHGAAGGSVGPAGRGRVGAAPRRPQCAWPERPGLSPRAADSGLRPRRGRGAVGDGRRPGHRRRLRRHRRGGGRGPDRGTAPATRLREAPGHRFPDPPPAVRRPGPARGGRVRRRDPLVGDLGALRALGWRVRTGGAAVRGRPGTLPGRADRQMALRGARRLRLGGPKSGGKGPKSGGKG